VIRLCVSEMIIMMMTFLGT